VLEKIINKTKLVLRGSEWGLRRTTKVKNIILQIDFFTIKCKTYKENENYLALHCTCTRPARWPQGNLVVVSRAPRRRSAVVSPDRQANEANLTFIAASPPCPRPSKRANKYKEAITEQDLRK